MRLRTSLLLPFVFLLGSCVYANLSLIQQAQPYKEKVIRGEGRPKILLVDITGVITLAEEEDVLRPGGGSMAARFIEALEKAEADEDVAGVVIRVNSPGGTVAASDILYHHIVTFKAKKKVPVYACITELGASGAYYAASAADKIMVHPASVTGSIGVIAVKFNVEKLLDKLGIEDEIFKTGAKKDFWLPIAPTEPEEREMINGIIGHLHERFVKSILAQRGGRLNEPELRRIADGRVLTAEEAVRANLADEVMYLEETIEAMKKDLKLDKARTVMYYRPGGYKGTIYSALPERPSPLAGLSGQMQDWLSGARGLQFMYLWNP